ncbi:SdpI family protein [Polycladomyces zharkentensis]|nr:SdpI family protein [Polycladomyces sp. WAk]
MIGNDRHWRWCDWASLAVAILPLLIAWTLYPALPPKMAVHFGFSGQPDGYQPKSIFLISQSLLLPAIPLLTKYLPVLDPKRENYAKFRRFYEIFRLTITTFLAVMFGLILAFNLGYRIHMQMAVLLMVGLIWMVIGNFLGQVRFNYFFGIRTPWTLADEEVWRRTHRLAAPLWMIAGGLMLISAFLPGWMSVGMLVAAIILTAMIPAVYSLIVYRKRHR